MKLTAGTSKVDAPGEPLKPVVDVSINSKSGLAFTRLGMVRQRVRMSKQLIFEKTFHDSVYFLHLLLLCFNIIYAVHYLLHIILCMKFSS